MSRGMAAMYIRNSNVGSLVLISKPSEPAVTAALR